MKHILIIGLIAFFLSLLCGDAFAQSGSWPPPNLLLPNNVAGPYSHYFPPGQTGFSPSGSSVASGGGGITVNASGAASVGRAGTITKIPVNIGVKISGAAVATAASRAARIARGLSGPLGLALTGWEIYNAYKDSGVKTCPPPDFFCVPGPDTEVTPTDGGYVVYTPKMQLFSGPASACNAVYMFSQKNNPTVDYGGGFTSSVINASTFYCFDKKSNIRQGLGSIVPQICPSGTTKKDGGCVVTGPDVPASDPDLEKAGGDAVGKDPSGGAAKNLWDAANATNDRANAAGAAGVPANVMIPAGSPTVVTAPAVTTSPVVINTQNFTSSDGVPQVRETTSTDTITPNASGQATSTTITYQVTNVVTTTTTNNTVNNTNNPTTVVKDTNNIKLDPVPVPIPNLPTVPATVPSNVQLPTDYNREVTQQAILESLSGKGMPTADSVDKDKDLAAISAQNGLGKTAIDGISKDSLGLFNWIPEIPTAACVNPKVQNPITQVLIPVEICAPFNIFKTFISYVICILAIFGMVQQIQSAAKA